MVLSTGASTQEGVWKGLVVRGGARPKVVFVGVYEVRGYFLSLKCGYNLCIDGQGIGLLCMHFSQKQVCLFLKQILVYAETSMPTIFSYTRKSQQHKERW